MKGDKWKTGKIMSAQPKLTGKHSLSYEVAGGESGFHLSVSAG